MRVRSGTGIDSSQPERTLRHRTGRPFAESDDVPTSETTPVEGDTRTFQRTLTTEDVRQFAEVSGDEQPRHLDPDEDGRLLVHGLLTAAMPTRIGGEMEVLGRSMTFDFLKPVYTGETVTCELTVEAVEERADRYDLSAAVPCRNGDDEAVMTGTVALFAFAGLLGPERRRRGGDDRNGRGPRLEVVVRVADFRFVVYSRHLRPAQLPIPPESVD